MVVSLCQNWTRNPLHIFSLTRAKRWRYIVYSGTGTWWGGVGRSVGGEAWDQTMQAVEEWGVRGIWGNFSVKNPLDALPEPGRRKQVSSFTELSHGQMCLKMHLTSCVYFYLLETRLFVRFQLSWPPPDTHQDAKTLTDCVCPRAAFLQLRMLISMAALRRAKKFTAVQGSPAVVVS